MRGRPEEGGSDWWMGAEAQRSRQHHWGTRVCARACRMCGCAARGHRRLPPVLHGGGARAGHLHHNLDGVPRRGPRGWRPLVVPAPPAPPAFPSSHTRHFTRGASATCAARRGGNCSTRRKPRWRMRWPHAAPPNAAARRENGRRTRGAPWIRRARHAARCTSAHNSQCYHRPNSAAALQRPPRPPKLLFSPLMCAAAALRRPLSGAFVCTGGALPLLRLVSGFGASLERGAPRGEWRARCGGARRAAHILARRRMLRMWLPRRGL